ncbi:hypothetical protein NQ317_008693 [Molorchus minor]|uniref:B30.2/SPRY domain-containing protein n=1 Tax=Molorchus minor TaxID=1323400 RepID=A0ABQ9K067_9CUCU|nr:hypothetical protein NQ317_008693 [Molorchus minor]
MRVHDMFFLISSNSQSAAGDTNMKHMSPFCTPKCIKGIADGKLQCDCGEDVGYLDWNWSRTNTSPNTILSKGDREILFHPLYSSGTAVVRGDVMFESNMHYYWEVKMISNLYGTDVMVGVGTSRIPSSNWTFRFCSMLGIDSHSWGYSYHGMIQHDKLIKRYGTQFGLGSMVGVHLDMCKGTLEYYVNRKPMGIAFKNLKNRDIYPMVCSTAAQSAVRISCAVSEKPTLQMKCLELISKTPGLYKRYKEIPGLRRYYERKYFWIVPTTVEEQQKRDAEQKYDLVCPSLYRTFLHRNRKMRGYRRLPHHGIIRFREDDISIRPEEDQEASASSGDGSNFEISLEGASSSLNSESSSSSSPEASASNESRNKIRKTESENSGWLFCAR